MNPARCILYSGPLSMFGAKAHIAALEKGLSPGVRMVPFDAQHRYRPKHPEVERINPKKQVPVPVHGDVEIFDSTLIFEYLEDVCPSPALWPGDAGARARARLLEHISDEIYFPPIVRLMALQDDLTSSTALAAIDEARRIHRRMEEELAGGEWLAGAYSYADIAFFMAQLFGERMGAQLDNTTPRLLHWRVSMMRRPAVRAAVRVITDRLIMEERRIPDFLN